MSNKPEESSWPVLGQQVGPWILARDYDLEGSGAMFVARRADGAFDRDVLITFLRPDSTNPRAKEDFELEVELQASLDHPGIAKVYGADTSESGIPYLVTEYLPGEDIEVYLDREQADLTRRMDLFRLVCDAAQHATDKGIHGLHLQANNVHSMPDGSIRLVVYGLAQFNQPADQTIAKTWPQYALEYASPEEWAAKPATTSSDVYSLGVILHLLTTGLMPHQLAGLTPAESSAMVNRGWISWASERVRNSGDETIAVRRQLTKKRLIGALSGDLDRILAKALAINPSERYAQPKDLAEDVLRHQSGQSIRARGPAPFYALRRTLARHRGAIAVAVLVLGSLAWAFQSSLQSAKRTETALVEAKNAEHEANVQSTRLRELCIRFLRELGPPMQGRKGLEGARRYLLDVGAPLLEHLKQSGHDDQSLREELTISYVQLAEAEWIARDKATSAMVPSSLAEARKLSEQLLMSKSSDNSRMHRELWARGLRAASWFAAMELDEEGGRAIIEQIVSDLKKVDIQEKDVRAATFLRLVQTRAVHFEGVLQFEKAYQQWDLPEIRRRLAGDPENALYIEAGLPRHQSTRSALMVDGGLEREALFELPTLVYQLGESVSAHQPPLLDLVAKEGETWLRLAQARCRVGLPPAEALDKSISNIDLLVAKYRGEAGTAEYLARHRTILAECYWNMGPEHHGQALTSIELSAQGWREILRNGAKWPQFQVELARVLAMKARILFAQDQALAANDSIREAQVLVANLASPAAHHVRTLWVSLTIELVRLRHSADFPREQLQSIETGINELQRRKVNQNLIDGMRAELNQLIETQDPGAKPDETSPKTPGDH